MKVRYFGFALMSLALIACGASEESASSEGAVTGHSLAAARNTVKAFYGQHGPPPFALGAEASAALTNELQRKIWDYFSTLEDTESIGTRGPFTGLLGGVADSITVGEPNYAFGLKEAAMTVRAEMERHNGGMGVIPAHEVLVNVRVRLSDLRISDISPGIECGHSFNLVGAYDMRSAYPSAEGGAGRVEVYWSEQTQENCAIARCVERCGERMTRAIKLRTDGADWVTDKGQYELFAGPVKVRAPSRCIDVAAAFGAEGVAGATTLENKHCR